MLPEQVFSVDYSPNTIRAFALTPFGLVFWDFDIQDWLSWLESELHQHSTTVPSLYTKAFEENSIG